jgi:hypothetical protein
LSAVTFPESAASPVARALGSGFKVDHPWDPYTDQPAHGPFEPVQPGPTQFDPKTGTVQGGGGPIGKIPPQPSAPTGKRGSPMDVPRGTNAPAIINGKSFSGHALDEMQSDGIPESAVDNALRTGVSAPSRGGTTVFYDPANHISVIQAADGTIVTVSYGDLRR